MGYEGLSTPKVNEISSVVPYLDQDFPWGHGLLIEEENPSDVQPKDAPTR